MSTENGNGATDYGRDGGAAHKRDLFSDLKWDGNSDLKLDKYSGPKRDWGACRKQHRYFGYQGDESAWLEMGGVTVALKGFYATTATVVV